jgi:hypothetical protein
MTTHRPPGIDADEIRTSLAQFEADFRAIDTHWERLRDEHDGAWVASHQGEFAFGATIEAVLNAAEAQGWPLNAVALRHLIDRAPTLL